jgi:hypothetical protein
VGSVPAYVADCRSPNPPSFSMSVKWKSSGTRVAPSAITFPGVFDANSRIAVYNGGTVTGSYAGEPPEARLARGICGPKGLKGSPFSGTFDINPCTSNIRTEIVPGQTGDGHIWWVIRAPECGYNALNHPTGTISWDYSREDNLPQCTGTNVPLTRVWPTDPYWGVDTNINLGALEGCFGQLTVFRYSGDARYRPYIGV